MGEIRKQSFYSSIYTYIGFSIGALNTLVLLTPKFGFFTLEQVGLTRLLLDFVALFSVIAALGSHTTFLKFFPYHEAYLKKKENDLPFLTTFISAVGTFLLIVFFLAFESFFARKFGRNSELFVENFKFVIPFLISVVIFNLFENFAWSVRKTITSNFAKEVIVRIATLVCITLYYLKWIDIETFFLLFSLTYVPAFLYVGFVLYKDGTIQFYTKISKVTKRLFSKMLAFAAFHFTGGLFSILPKTIDGLIISSIIGLDKNGIYAIPTYLITVMEVPQRSMLGIGSATISTAWRNNDIGKIKNIYQKSSINLFVLGLMLFGLLFPNIDNLIRFMGEEYAPIKFVFLILGLAKLVDLLMGLNSLIMGFSKYWRIDFYINLVLILLAISFTYFLSLRFGIYGTAIGSAVTMLAYNLMRFVFINSLFHIQPFTRKTVGAIMIGLIAVAATFLLPYLGNYFVDASVRVIIFLLCFVPPILYFKISPDINDMFDKAKNKFFKSNK